jgi:hypothetical protein
LGQLRASRFPFLNQLKNSSQRVNVKNAARQGYTKIRGDSCGSSLMRTKNKRAATVSSMPMTPHNIHEGKNEPRILKEGMREHPANESIAAEQAATVTSRIRSQRLGEFKMLVILRPFGMEQVSSLEG